MILNVNSVAKSAGVRVVEASAGSGKTFALAKRYVQILLDPKLSPEQIPIRNVLAITFTNKAAYAMKGRILEFLKKIAVGQFSDLEEREILRPIGLTKAEARPRAVLVMEALIHNYNFFQVQTIDSFINALLSGCAFKIGLSANFKIKRNFTDYLDYSLDHLIEQAAGDKASYEILNRFLHQYLFLENKTGWFPKKDMLGLLKALYNSSNTYGRDFKTYQLPGDDLVVRKKKIMSAMRRLRESLPEGVHSTFLKSFDDFLAQYQDGFDFDRVSKYFSREEIPVKKGVEVSREIAQQWEYIHRQLKQLSEAEAYSLFNPYVEVFNRTTEDFRLKAAEEDILFLPELNRKARQLFDEGMVTVEELYYRLATRFHHYLLDEFQDTSRLQWQNLSLMIEEALSTGGTFFYVGDKKQAIYGFRGGEIKLFDEVKRELGRFGSETELLTTNYRSQKHIIEFNNYVFSAENLERFIRELDEAEKDEGALSPDDIEEIKNIFQAAQQKVVAGRDQGCVRIESVESKAKIERNEDIRSRTLALLQELKTRFAYNQIAILTRDNSEIEEVTAWLMAAGIFVESERTLNIKENKIVQELIAFLKFLDSPIDHLNFALFVTGELFCRATKLSPAEVHEFLFSLRQRQEKEVVVYKAFQERFPEVWSDYLEEFFKNVGLFPLYELCSSILRRFQALENFPDDQGFLLRFLELITEKEEEYTDLSSFLEKFEALEDDELFVNVVNSDAIKVLTIHKAKGLEFPVVILPFLGIKVHGATGGGLGQQSYILDLDENHMKLLRIKAKYVDFSEKLKEIQRREKVRSFISELNNIYVALTRAEKEMYAFIPSKVGGSRNMARQLIPETHFCVGTASSYPQKVVVKNEGQVGLPVAGDHDWIQFLREEFSGTERVFDPVQARRGEALHAILAELGNLAGKDPQTALGLAIDRVKSDFLSPVDWKECEDRIRQILALETLRSIFNVTDGEIFVEKDIVDSLGRTKRIDRLIVRSSEIVIVDFKTSREGRTHHLQQLADYQAIVKDTHPGIKIKGLLIYLDDLQVEEV